ncbi:MAG: GH25 family lysozyme [Solirubrobacterales bacterium]
MQNGKLKAGELHRIYHPKLKLFLGADGASASWNTMRMHLLHTLGKQADIYPEGPLGAYRDFAGQVKCKADFGANAATPGTSNHGLGHAVDVNTHAMADLIDKYGGMFGWHHWDATWEWWHREYDGGFTRPDPGIDARNPILRLGSGGAGQAWAVRRLQAHLDEVTSIEVDHDGDFGDETRKAVVHFQRMNKLKANGVVHKDTWAALRAAPPFKGKKKAPKRTPAAIKKKKTADAQTKRRLRGFDVSDGCGDIDFAKAKHHHQAFASVSIGDGDIRDTRYGPGRVKALRESGLAWFPYYYARVAGPHNGERSGADEAKMAIKMAKAGGWGKQGDLPLAYDFETLNGQSAKKCARHIINFIKAYRADRGHLPIIYTMPDVWGSVYPHFDSRQRDLLKQCPLWIAHWDVAKPQFLSPWGNGWSLWQDSDHGIVDGVPVPTDTDWYKGAPGTFDRLIVP